MISDRLSMGHIRSEKSTLPSATEKEISSSSFKFGYSRYRPSWLQFFNRGPFLLAALCFCAICQSSIVNGFISTSISSLEKRFSLSSTQSGFFTAFYDVAVVCVLIPLSHYGNKCHKGRVIASGMVLVGIGSIVLVLPHFLAGRYIAGERRSNLCSTNELPSTCSTETSADNALWYYILLASQIFIGFGAAPLFTLGISFMDENVAQNSVSLYLGVYMACSTIGPAIGFIAGGQLLKVWGDLGKSDYHDFEITGPSDPRWYGAWWLGFLAVGILSIVSSIPLYGFPRELPEKQLNRSKDVKQTHKDLDKEYGRSLKAYPKVVFSLICNQSVMAIMMMQTTEAFLMNGFITFIPKLFENLFAYSASYASTVTGVIVVPMGLFGSLFGAIMVRKTSRYRPTIALAILFNICALLLSLVFLHKCEQRPFAGVTVDYNGNEISSTNLTSTCSRKCHCDTTYNPVCSVRDAVNYYSPCFAGCTFQYDDYGHEWGSCMCVLDMRHGESSSQERSANVVKGLCNNKCSQKTFFVIFALLCFFTFSSAIPIQNSALRVVSFDTRDVAIGLSWLFMRVLGSIPGAVFFGVAIDSTCVLWKEECGKMQSCLRYNSNHLSRMMLFFAIGLKSLIIFFLATSYYFYKPSFDEEAKTKEDFPKGMDEVAEALRDETLKVVTDGERTCG